jgi:hypothetical protein
MIILGTNKEAALNRAQRHLWPIWGRFQNVEFQGDMRRSCQAGL